MLGALRASLRTTCLATVALWCGQPSAQSLTATGKALAEEHCSRCHVVSADDPFSGIGSTPSFELLVTALPDWKERFETFHGRRPHPSVVRFEGVAPITADPPTSKTVDLKLSDIDAIVAYAASLKEATQKSD
jgi:mono/diheme cytochrome c family protein